MASNPTQSARGMRYTIADVVASVVLADGNLHYVAEHYGLTAEELLNKLSSDPSVLDMLSRGFRTRALIKQFEVMGEITDTLHGKITDMRSDHLVGAFKAMSASFATLSASGQVAGPGQTNVNIFDRVLQMLPPEAREAIRVLQATSDDNEPFLAITQPDPLQSGDSHGLLEPSMQSSADAIDTPLHGGSRPALPVQAGEAGGSAAPMDDRARIMKLLRE